MRIDSYNSPASQISAEQTSRQVSAQGSSNANVSGTEDRASLSSGSTSVSSLVSQALQFPEVRQDKVDSLKQSVGNGTYELNPSKIASSILEQG
jgi:flagellar biosynthesis anti-sigma factor FlgM